MLISRNQQIYQKDLVALIGWIQMENLFSIEKLRGGLGSSSTDY